ncbi:FAD-dependent oxidoreductase [Schaedlerella arabinosiphila]|uniref:FAD-dependent oxidoreductase n=1 Tax=Schaedlerella arabinosiphila TaxID=2044587 RepID=A0A9X5C949_9FIRM|nr:FAD-dependent oxidoreductase [Schaedlerella arabinosiphila]NDO70384.1 FAD-dependent oxidoreductase [Schaedlerella arabinosiphila]
MYRESIWQQTTAIPARPELPGNISTDIAIVGGGLAGILTAHFLEQSGRQCIVLEADRVGSGQTGHTTAKVTSQHGLIYQKLIRCAGKKKAMQYAKINQDAIERYRILIEKYKIDCDWEECPACLYTKESGRALRDEYYAAKELGLPVEMKKRTELPFAVEDALFCYGQACFHPLKFLQVIAENIQVYEKTKVLRVKPHLLTTSRGTVEAEKIVFACHYPFVNRPGYYFLRMHQERSYVCALKEAQTLHGMYLGIDRDGLSFRPAGELLLLGGGNHRTGENPMGGQYEFLLHQAEVCWPEKCWTKDENVIPWSAQDCMTLDGIPYIGQFGRKTEDWFVATGFGKWGMTSSMAAAILLTDQICGRENPCGEVFSPQRLHPMTSAKPFLTEGTYAAVNLLKQTFAPPKEKLNRLLPGQAGVVEYNGQKAGVYKAEDGQIFAVSVKCPHMGCQLVWNPDEKSWDCHCHGSRFDYRGRLIDGPAQTAVDGEFPRKR